MQKYAPEYGIKVCSPIIAQAILESASGTSELAIKAHNYFGLKYRPNRCPTSNGTYTKVGSEQLKSGEYISSQMLWMKFPNMESGVIGYFDFINVATYQNLKGVTDPVTYLKNIKADGYATSLDYVERLMAVISKYNLEKYDKEGKRMVINIHAGHNPDGKIACGAVGLIKESTQARNVKNKVIEILRADGHTVYDCTCEAGSSQNNVLSRIVAKCNEHTVDLDISIHFNSGRNDYAGDGKTGGTEVFVYSNSASSPMAAARRIVNNIALLGYTNRGVKVNPNLYVLKHTKNKAILIECCFVDDADDVRLFNVDKMAMAIASGILDKTVEAPKSPTVNTGAKAVPFKVKVTVNSLNIREGAGTSYKVVGTISNGGTYTITEVKGSWGRLKSGAGWINISTAYVKYV